jgi:hypothetical protein
MSKGRANMQQQQQQQSKMYTRGALQALAGKNQRQNDVIALFFETKISDLRSQIFGLNGQISVF